MHRTYLSHTQLAMMLKCPRQYYYRYIEGVRTPANGALILGSAGHSACEANYSEKIHTKRDLPVEQLIDVFATAFDYKKANEDVVLGSKEPKWGELKDLGVKMVKLFREEVAPQNQPRLVEQDWEVSLGEDFPWGLRVILDLVTTDDEIIDNKFYGKTPAPGSADSDIQLSTYALGFRIETGRIESGLKIDAMIKLKTPKYVPMQTTRTEAEIRWHIGMIEELGRQIHTGLFPPNPTGWWCNKRWCGFWDRCKGGQTKETS